MEQQPVGWAKIKGKILAEPLIPFGALATAAILVGGIVTFSRGGSKELQQRFMRARVLAQGATLSVIAYGAYETAKSGPPQFDEAKYRGNSQFGK